MRIKIKKLTLSLLFAAATALALFVWMPFPAMAQAYVPVTGISGVPETAIAGKPLELKGTVTPADATNQAIKWSVKDAGTTGATIDGNVFNVAAAGTAEVTAMIVDGLKDGSTVAVATGEWHTVALKGDGTLWAWGSNDSGQLGLDLEVVNYSNVPVQISTDKWKAVAAGSYHTVALKEDGTLWAWGWNDYGQIGVEASEVNGCVKIVTSYDDKGIPTSWYWACTPVQVGTDKWKAVATGYAHTLALKMDGSLWAWGDNYFGQLGDGKNVGSYSPVRVGLANDWKAVTAGNAHTVALKTDGSLWTWGWNVYGQLGIGSNNGSCSSAEDEEVYCPEPIRVGSGNDWAMIAAGSYHTVALKENGARWSWGYNSDGQLGIGNSENHSSCIYYNYSDDADEGGYWYCPDPVVGPDNNWVSVTAGATHTAALKTDGSLWVWGDASYGQLGIGLNPGSQEFQNKCSYSNEDYGYWYCHTPVKVGLDDEWALVSINSSSFHTMAVKKDGSLWAWGWNDYGQLGDGTYESSFIPLRITIPADPGADYMRDFMIKVFSYGDVNGDGFVNLADIMIMARSLADWEGAVINNAEAADVDVDGFITLRDLLVLRRHFANWEGYETLPWMQHGSQALAPQFALMSGAQSIAPAIALFNASGNAGDVFETGGSFAQELPAIEVALIGAVPSASVKKLNGNKNELTVTVKETFSNGAANTATGVFSISNNAADSYKVGSYVVYVEIKGGDQIRQCYIVN